MIMPPLKTGRSCASVTSTNRENRLSSSGVKLGAPPFLGPTTGGNCDIWITYRAAAVLVR